MDEYQLLTGVWNPDDYARTTFFRHRDIAARNMLLNVESRTEFTVKVADFGLSKVTTSTFHSKTGDSKVPIPTRWTSLEALCVGSGFVF